MQTTGNYGNLPKINKIFPAASYFVAFFTLQSLNKKP